MRRVLCKPSKGPISQGANERSALELSMCFGFVWNSPARKITSPDRHIAFGFPNRAYTQRAEKLANETVNEPGL